MNCLVITQQNRLREDLVPHNCEAGHVWKVRMVEIKKNQYPWRYVNKSDKLCPVCGRPQSEEEPI